MKARFLSSALVASAILFTANPAPAQKSTFSSVPEKPWTASGRVTTADGLALFGAEIWVHTGMGSLKRVATAKTDKSGRYSVDFGRGVLMPVDRSNLQVANVTAHHAGFFEKNLSRHGARAAALREVSADELKTFGVSAGELFLPGKPQTIDFVMAPAAQIRGKLLGTGSFSRLPPQVHRANKSGHEELIAGYTVHARSPLAKWRLWLVGKELPPATSALPVVETDAEGAFTMSDVPVGFEWQFQVETRKPGTEPKGPAFRIDRAGEEKIELELLAEPNELRMQR